MASGRQAPNRDQEIQLLPAAPPAELSVAAARDSPPPRSSRALEDRVGVERGSDEGPGVDRGEAHRPRLLLQGPEPVGRHEPGDGGVAPRGAEVLADRDDVHLRAAQVGQDLPDLLVRLPQTDHEAALADLGLTDPLAGRQQVQGTLVPALGPDPGKQPGHRLDVVVEHVGRGLEQSLQGVVPPSEIGCQDLDARPGESPAQLQDGFREDRGAAVGQVVAGHRREHDVAETEPGRRLGDPARLVGVWRQGPGRGHRAVGTAPRATVPQEHEGRGPPGEALPEVRAASLLAHRGQRLLAKQYTEGPGTRLEGPVLARPVRQAPPGAGRGLGGELVAAPRRQTHCLTMKGWNFSWSRSFTSTRSASARFG
jgi:hypothetical protein